MANQLQAILKSNKIDIAVGIDKKRSAEEIKSGLQSLINDNKDLTIKLGVELSSNIKDINKELRDLQKRINDSSTINNAIKLDVKIESSIKKLSSEITAIQNKIGSSSSIKPIKLDVDIDINGSALRIAGELGKIKKTIEDFEKDYSSTLKKVKSEGDKNLGGVFNDQTTNGLKNNLQDIKRYMNEAFGGGEVSTKVFRDYRTGIETLSATVKRETGEISTAMFKIQSNGNLELFKETEVNKMEATTAKAKKSMESLASTVQTLKANLKGSNASELFDNLQGKEFVSEGEISKLKQLISAEKELMVTEQKRTQFTRELQSAMSRMSPDVSNVTKEVKALDISLDGLNSKEIDVMSSKLKTLSQQYRSDENTLRQRANLLKVLEETQKQYNRVANESRIGASSNSALSSVQSTITSIKNTNAETMSVKDLTVAMKSLSSAKLALNQVENSSQQTKSIQDMIQATDQAKKLIKALKDVGAYNQSDVKSAETQLANSAQQSISSVKSFSKSLSIELDRAKVGQKELIRNFDLISASVSDPRLKNIQSGIFKALDGNIDTGALKRYFGELKNGEVSTINVTEKTNQFGQAVNEVKLKMAGTGKTVEAYTFQMNKSNDATQMAVKETGKAIVDNENKALGFRQQIEIAMKRIPSYILSMQGIYAVVNGFKNVGNEIMEINKQMIEIQRVAGAGINTDNLLTGAISQAKELGNNVHDILDALGEYSRTFDGLSEQQLLTVTKTAVVMSNVSDLSLDESVTNLVGTMNAFNISAEESLHIVDALNEMDNNYSISTKQLSASLSRAGATAETFGVTMEELGGNTTAIGAVTQESGEIIGNSLKTIYSRITTMEPSIGVLDDLGISIKEMTENGIETKSVSKILGELAGQWDSLSNTQKQNIGVTIAGRNQLSRFLALMNNWQMSVDATNAGINSSNSAMNEQSVHMQSYEAKVNALKTRFTELSLAIGKAFLSDGLMVGIDVLGKLSDGVVKVIGSIGMLPAMFGVVGGLALKFTGLSKSISGVATAVLNASSPMGEFKDQIGLTGMSIKESFQKISFVKDFSKGFSQAKTSIVAYQTATKGAVATQGIFTASMVTTRATLAGLKTAFLGFMASTAGITLGLTALAVGVGVVAEKFIKAKNEEKQLTDRYNSNVKKSIEQFNKYGNNFDDLISKYEKLDEAQKKGKLNDKDQEEYNNSIKELSNIMPNAVAYVDANGEAHMKSTKEIRKEAEAVKELNAQQVKQNDKNFTANLSKQEESYEKLNKKLGKYKENLQLAETSMTGLGNSVQDKAEKANVATAGMFDVQSKMSKELSKSSTTIGENAIAWMNAEGKMKNVSDAGQGLIDTFAKSNQYAIDSKEVTDGFASSQEKLSDKTKAFASVLGESYDKLSALGGAGGKKAVEIFDSMVKSFDSETLKSDNLPLKLEAISSSIMEMGANADNFNSDQFISSLTQMGLSQEDAKKYTMELGTQLDNQKIKTAIAREEMVTYNDTLNDFTTATYEAIDAQKIMLGLKDGESEDINSRLEYVNSMKKINEDTYRNNAEVQAQIEKLSEKTKLSKKTIEDNSVAIAEAYGVMTQKAKEVPDMIHMPVDKLREANKDMSDEGFRLLQQMLENLRNGSTSLVDNLVQALSKGKAEIDGKTEEIQKSFAKLQQNPKDSNVESSFYNKLKDDLSSLQGQISAVVDQDGNVKKMFMLNGEKSTYLDEVNKQLETMGITMKTYFDPQTGTTKLSFIGLDGSARDLYTVNNEIQNINTSTGILKDTYAQFKSNMNETTRSQWLDSITNQYQAMQSDVKLAGDDVNNLKLVLANGGTNTWLDSINAQVKDLGGKLITTKDEAGNLQYKLQMQDGSQFTLFTTASEGAKTATKEVKNTDQAVTDTRTNAEKGAVYTVKADDSGVKQANTAIDETRKNGNTGVVVKTSLLDPFGTFGQFDQKVDKAKKKGEEGVKVETKVDTVPLAPLQTALDNFKKDGKDKVEVKVTTNPIELKALEQADGTIQTTQKRLEGLIGNIGTLKGGVNETVGLLETNLLGKNPLVQTLADKLGEVARKANEAGKAITDIEAKAGNINFTVKGSFELPTDFEARASAIANSAKELQASVSRSMSGIKGSLAGGLKIGSVDTSSLDVMKNTIQQRMSETSAILSTFGSMVASAVASANQAMVFDASSLILYRNTSVAVVQSLTGLWAGIKQTLPAVISSTTSSMNSFWIAGTNGINARGVWLRNQLVGSFNSTSGQLISIISNMTSKMQSTFRAGTSAYYGIASAIPAQIGKGISDNMNDATGSLQSLADNMVKRFKSALGIHSPSRVFEELGGYVIAGLTNGLTGGNLKDLGKTVFKDFGGGVFDTMDMIKAYVSGDFSAMAGDAGGAIGAVGGGVQQWAGVATKALMMTNQFSPSNLQALLYQMQTESGGNPRAINNWDVNAVNGTPSKGLMQVIDPTFQANKMPGFNNIYAPLDNILASIRYALGRYGSLANAYRGHGYYNGGFVNTPEIAWHGEEGAEAIIPLIPKRRKRGIELWMETAQRLGLGNMIGLKGSNGAGATPTGFGASEGESGTSGASEGGSGTYVPSVNIPNITASVTALAPIFNESAEKSLDALYKRDSSGLKIDQTQTKIDKSEIALKKLIENTVAYRNQLLGIQKLNKNLLGQQQAQYNSMIKRQQQIAGQLSQLQNTGKHTEEQRKRYNELQQEYDTNSGNLWKLETTIANLEEEIRQSNINIYLDYIADIGNRWDTTIKKITNAKDKLSFNLEKLELTNPNDVGGQLKIRYDMAEQQQKLEKTYGNQVATYQKEYNEAVKKYGSASKQAVEMQKMLEEAQKNYQDAQINTLKTNKEIADAREKIAQDEVTSLKNYYKQMQTLSKQATDKELENLKKTHDAKIKAYDEEIKKINDVYDATIKQHDEQKSEDEYNAKMDEFNTKRVDIMQKISMASRDNSLDGKKALADLQKQLTDLNKEIVDAQKDRQETLWKNELDQQKQQQLDKIEANKEAEDKVYEDKTDDVNNKAKEIADYYDKIINDDTKWKDAIDKWNKGDTSVLTEMMNDMRNQLSGLMSGDGKGIMGIENLSGEDIKAIVGDNLTDVSNIWLSIKDQLTELNSINKNLNDLNANQQQGNNSSNPAYTTGNGTSSGVGHNDYNPHITPPPAPAKPPANKGVKATHVVVSGDTLWDLAKKYYGDYYQWTKIQKANGGIDPYRVPIGKKLIIPFDTGGYTGDWMGNEGRVAMLHKKELVLNKNQTEDILNTVSVVERAKTQMKEFVRSVNNNKQSSNESSLTTVGDINLYFPDFKGNQNGANLVAQTLLDKLKTKR